MTPEIIQIIGSVGAFLILVAFILNQTHKWSPQHFSYDFTNLVGSALLVWYAFLLKSTPFIILNLVWVVVSLRDVIQDLRRK